MRKFRLVIFFLCFFVSGSLLFSQNHKETDSLIAKAKININLLSVDADKSYREAQKIYTRAVASQNHVAELIALKNICLYYDDRTFDFQKLLETAEILDRKSDEYRMPVYQVYAKVFLFDVYAYNGLYRKAKQQLDQGTKILKKTDDRDPSISGARERLYNAYSNYYALLKDPVKSLEYTKLLTKEHERKKADSNSIRALCVDYSNIAMSYFEINIDDSAEYYAWKSIEVGKTCDKKNLSFPNFLILGNIYQKRLRYEDALQYYHQAEQLKEDNNYMNIILLYNNMIDIYTKKKDTANVNQYRAKLENLNLKIIENKNNSLSKVIDNMENNDQKKNIYLIVISTLLSIAAIIIIVIMVRRRQTIIQQEKISQQYLEKELKNQTSTYSDLIDMVKNNDLAFFSAFKEIFPDFAKKILNINPKMVQSEIEFCALLKLNISTKDIARYKFIEPKTVQNKKYHIRKKLNIPDNMDIYHWLGNL
jgi:tetratricopeptide (TPR) repeat protein/DNA-binding CsgD family transcriptional regulator